jgi:hypothetical protein
LTRWLNGCADYAKTSKTGYVGGENVAIEYSLCGRASAGQKVGL